MLRPRRGEPTGVGRTEAFSDGVFAVAITLLACAASLVFIGVAWTNHHNVFRRVALQTWTRPLGYLNDTCTVVGTQVTLALIFTPAASQGPAFCASAFGPNAVFLNEPIGGVIYVCQLPPA